MEWCYNKHIMDMAAQQKKKEVKEKPGPKPALSSKSSKPTRIKNLGHGETINIHLKKKAPGQAWTPVLPKDDGPDVRKCYEKPRRQESTGTGQAGQTPLTEELLTPGESVTTILDLQYEDRRLPRSSQTFLRMWTWQTLKWKKRPWVMSQKWAVWGTMSTSYGTLMTPHWGPLPWLRPRRTSCWMREAI